MTAECAQSRSRRDGRSADHSSDTDSREVHEDLSQLIRRTEEVAGDAACPAPVVDARQESQKHRTPDHNDGVHLQRDRCDGEAEQRAKDQSAGEIRRAMREPCPGVPPSTAAQGGWQKRAEGQRGPAAEHLRDDEIPRYLVRLQRSQQHHARDQAQRERCSAVATDAAVFQNDEDLLTGPASAEGVRSIRQAVFGGDIL